MSIFDVLAEERIRAALARGDLAGLPGEGQPLVFDDDCLVPVEVRMTNRVLRNAGYVPPAVADLKALRALAAGAPTAADPVSDARRQRQMTRLLLQLEAAGLSHVAAALLRRAGPDAGLPDSAQSAELPLK
ncbi:DnaJ family domain-containing protein [Zoogloea sp.]|jgi:hypothetical protein|uniref:DnaJ family domain-containing protein n=1 Tax=Zoogloea sp. TaxID=49181 RepID=UPI0035B178FB